MKKSVRSGLLAVLATLSWSVQAQTVAVSPETKAAVRQDRLISQLYVEQAATAYQKGDYHTADSLLHVALEFDPTNSDALFLRGESDEKAGGKIPGAIASYQAALDSAHWSRFDATACTMKLAPLLIHTKHYGEAVGLLQGVASLGANLLYYNAQSLIGLGRDYQAQNLLAQAITAFPADERFPLLRIRIDPRYRDSVAARYLSAPNRSSIQRSVLVSLIVAVGNLTEKKRLIELYDRSFPASKRVFAQSLLASAAVTPAEINTFVSDGLLADGSLTRRLYAHLPSGPAKSELAAKVGSYTGTVALDTNGDGFNEEEADYAAGKLTRLTFDPSQDGVAEYDVSFSNGIPTGVVTTVNGITYHLTYGDYPFVSSAIVDQKGEKANYALEPGRVSFALFGASSMVPGGPAAFPPVVKNPPAIGIKELFAFATQINTTDAVSNLPVSLWKKSIDNIMQLAKQWQNGRYTYRAYFHNGQKFSAEIDPDNDGYYEVHEYYRNGKVWKITYDGDKDGIPEFTLVLDPYPILSWDFNDDGVADEIEKKISPTTTVLEFSTKMNGVFDVTTKEVKK